MYNFIIFISLMILLIFILSIILMRAFRKRKYVVYIPTLLTWLLSIKLFIYGWFFANQTQTAAIYLTSMMAGFASLVILTITLIIMYKKNKK